MILVTGGTGYIGSHTCVELLKNGYEVVIIDNLSNSNNDVVDRIKKITNKDLKFYFGDVSDKELLRRIFTEKYGKSAIPRNKRRQQMGEFNMEYVKKYSIEVVDKQMRKIYADLLGGEN